MQKIIVKLSEERLITPSGLSLVGTLLGKSKIVKQCNRTSVSPKRSQPQIKNGDILLTYIGLLCQGKTEFEAVKEMEEDPEFYRSSLGIVRALPSTETLRQRMDDIGDNLRKEILQANITMFKNAGIEPGALPNGFVPVDIDVSPFDNSKTKKEGVSRTYKGMDGYSPIFAYIGTEGYLVNSELREGKQHCQKGTPAFLCQTLKLCHQLTDKPLLIRLDSGNDAAENLGILLEDGSWFIVKRNPRRSEAKEVWLDNVKAWCRDIRHPREGKTVYVGTSWKDVTYQDSDNKPKSVGIRIGYEVTERTIDKNGQIRLAPDIELNTWWTNLGLSDDEIIRLYHAHGECEQYHSEIKSDMGVERLPSGKFATNELVLELTILAYNILRIIGQESLKCKGSPKTKRPIKRRRLRTVISNLILIASLVVEHGGNLVLFLGQSNIWRFAFLDIFRKFYSA